MFVPAAASSIERLARGSAAGDASARTGAGKVWSTRYGEINQFEKLIVGQNKTTILKFFLHIFKEERLTRFAKRVDDPARQWKISESDYKERDYWDDYIEAFEDVPGENEHRARALVRDSFKS